MRALRFSSARVCCACLSLVLATSSLVPKVAYASTGEQDSASLELVSSGDSRDSTSASKSETVHVSTDAAGVVTGITVEDVLRNVGALDELSDLTTLADIVPSDENVTYTTNDDGTLTWAANGADVSYEGTSSAKPPVTVRVSYTLDGQSVAPQDLAGANGHLAIRLDYQNNASETRTIDGRDERIHTPFVCLTAAILDDEVFSNVTITNGKLVSDKGGFAVIGFAAPGLRQSLNLDEDSDINIPEYVQIEADVDDLVLDPLYTIVTPELFGEMDTSDLDLGELDELGDGTGELRDAMGELVDGAGTLSDALWLVADGSSKVGGGARALLEALNPLPNGLSQLEAGANTLTYQLNRASSAIGGLKDGASGIGDAADGARQLVDAASGGMGTASTLVSDVRQRLNTGPFVDARAAMSDASTTADAASGALTTAQGLIEGVSGKVHEQRDAASADIAAAQETLDALLANVDMGLTGQQRSALEGVRNQLSSAHTSVSGIDATPPAELTAQAAALSDASKTIAADAGKIGAASAKLDPIAADADGALEALAGAAGAAGTASQTLDAATQGARDIAEGVDGAATGLSALAEGASTLAEGIGTASSSAPQALAGINALAQGSDQLTTALTATASGSDKLTSGLAAFNDEGITKLADVLDDFTSTLDGTSDRIDALRASAADYDTFAGKTDGQEGTVRFIYKTERIG
ncbi:MAG: hypothetical protein IKG22_13140 [Atopobiaceae bacterium]|nr:hypothetical protein [Atopobiaceae bacterium]